MFQEAGLPYLSSWQNFYMIAGTAAATLTGLMFVASTLVAGFDRDVSTLDAGVTAFNTPTVVHFGVVLLLAGVLSAPWQAFFSLSLTLCLVGLALVIYLFLVIQRLRHIPGYPTPLRDWLWYAVFPLSAYIALIIGALALLGSPATALYIISAVMVALLFVGIRNAWDLVTFLAIGRSHPENHSQ